MFDSKALKDFPEKKRSKLAQWWLMSPIGDWYHDITWKFFGKPWSHAKKMYDWYKNVFRFDYDFDGHCLFAIIEYKLKRIERALLNGCAWQEEKDMHALKVAIKLAGRLKEDKYDIVAYDRMDKKYGESKTWFEPCNDGSTNSYMRSSRSKVNTEEEKDQEMKYRREQYMLAENKTKREERWLYAIMHKHLRVWWD